MNSNQIELWDYYAAAAITGLASSQVMSDEFSIEYVAARIADDMMALRKTRTATTEQAEQSVITWRNRMRGRMVSESISQTELAQRMNVTQGTISHWLSGRRSPDTLEQYEALAKALNIHPAQLLYGLTGEQA